MTQLPDSDHSDTTCKGLNKLGGAAAYIVAGLTLGEVFLLIFYPQPDTIKGWFTLFQSNKFIGLLDFWGLEIPMYIAFIFVFLALYVVLRRTQKSLMMIVLILTLLGVGVFLSTNNPFSMLFLSNQYTAAITDSDRSAILAAGQAILANTNQRAVGGFNLGLFLVSMAGLMVSFAMLHGNSFSRFNAIMGILANGLSLADYLQQALTSSAMIALLVIIPNALGLVIWYILVGRRLYQLGQKDAVGQP